MKIYMEKNITRWHGRLENKHDSMFVDGLALRYDPRLRGYELILWRKPNVYSHITVSEKRLEEFALSPNFDTDAFQSDSKLTMLQWSRLGFLDRFTTLCNFVGVERIPKETEEEILSAKEVCKMIRIKYDSDMKFC